MSSEYDDAGTVGEGIRPVAVHVQPAWLTWLARVLLGGAVVVVAVAVSLPGTWLAELRRQWRWFSHMISRTEQLWPAVDMVHVVMFAGVGVLLALAFPAWRFRHLLVAISVLAAVSEFVQIWVPGRTASAGDVVLDLVAGLSGVLPVLLLRRIR